MGLLWRGSLLHPDTAFLSRKGLSQSALPYRRSVPTVSSVRVQRRGREAVGGAISCSEDGDHMCMSAVLRVERAAALRFHPGFLVLRPLSFPRTVAEAHF